ncbi:hypothetical protein IAD21_01416 [Abditibacteriota bacterium]|nr:hypothetical protein IAD21_01416 [Abditibacteriota bacterium]
MELILRTRKQISRWGVLMTFVFTLTFCVAKCVPLIWPQVGAEEFSTIPLQKKKAPASIDKAFSSPSRGHLSLSYMAPTGINGKRVWLLLFEPKIPPESRPINTRFEGYTESEGPVTLLVVEPSPTTLKSGWHVINSIPLGIVSKLRKDYITLRWIEPAKQKGPVIFVNKLGGESELIAFTNGWNQPNPVRQTYSGWMRWDDGAKYDFFAVDTRGFLCVTETYSTYSHEPPNEVTGTKYHFWNGKGWR